MTLMCTSLLEPLQTVESTPLEVSTIADTWIHLNYLVQSGERNRGLSIVKSRGTRHSNQVRELILSDSGVTLEDVYAAEGEVLMGTMRWAREREEQLRHEERASSAHLRSLQMAAETAALESKIRALEHELALKRTEEAAATDREVRRVEAHDYVGQRLQKLRWADDDEGREH